MALDIIFFIIILLILVLSHEFGHFIFARLSKIKVEEFAFGFPPRIASIKRGETRYSFNLLPLGGYVKIHGEEGNDAENERSFASKGLGTKVLIIAAGAIFNLILAYFLMTSGFIFGVPVPLADNDPSRGEVRITEVVASSPAELAGLETGDSILSLSSANETVEIKKISEVQDFISSHLGREITVTISRRGEITERPAILPEKAGLENEGTLGIAMARIGIERLGPLKAAWRALEATFTLTILTVSGLLALASGALTGGASFEAVSGPVGIVNLVGDFSHFGFLFLIQFTAILSINLAIINLIPIPGLDGGRIFLLLLEKIKGSPFNWKVTQAIHAAGLAFLITLIVIVTYHDILKLTS